jgi:hypothetical protein
MDNKYGRLFIESDVQAILEYAVRELDIVPTDDEDYDERVTDYAANLLAEALTDKADIRFKFGDDDEPQFVLRGRDKRAAGAIKHYRDHQSPSAPDNHTDAIQKAFRAFNDYRERFPGQMKEPD